MREIVGIFEPRSDRRAALLRAMLGARPTESGMWEGDDLALGCTPHHHPRGDTSFSYHHEESGVSVVYAGTDDLGAKGTCTGDRISELYLTHGPGFVAHLADRFAVALWDPHNHRLVLARDRLGQLPLYYTVHGGKLAFGSRLGALVHDATLPLDLDRVAVRQYLELKYVPAPRSILASVKKVPPGHVTVVEGKDMQVRTTSYWSPQYAPKHTLSLEDAATYIRDHLLTEARGATAGPSRAGAFLSGGLDSSAVVAAMARISPDPVPTFAVGFEAASHNELPFARQVAAQYSTDHHEVVVTSAAVRDLAPLAGMFDEPYADASALPTLFASRLAATNVPTVYTGDGGDETLGGYLRYARQLRHRHPRPWAFAASAIRRLPHSRHQQRLLAYASRYALPPEDRYFLTMTVFTPRQLDSILGPSLKVLGPESGAQGLITNLWERYSDLSEVDRMMAVDLESYLPGDLLPKVEVTSAAQVLSVRSPFLTIPFVDWAARLPVDLKIRRGETKYVLKHALAPWLPDDLIHRRKQGFGVPLDGWLRGEWSDLLHQMLHSSRGVQEGWWREDTLLNLMEEQMAGTNHSPRLYPILMFELWLEQFAEVQGRV